MTTETPKPTAIETIESIYEELGCEHRRNAADNSDWLELVDCDIQAFVDQQAAEGRIPPEHPFKWFLENFLLPLQPRLARSINQHCPNCGDWAVW